MAGIKESKEEMKGRGEGKEEGRGERKEGRGGTEEGRGWKDEGGEDGSYENEK